ncbi:MAG TPA: ABC transporter transmembrane domain-containing protein [Micavibrio sp.]
MIFQSLTPDGFKINRLQLIVPTLFICVLSLTLPVLTLQVYDRILPNPESGTMPVLISGVCVAIVLEICLRLSRSYVLGWSGAAYEHKLSCQAVSHVLQSDLATLEKDGHGENLNRMTAIGKLREFNNGYNLITYTEFSFVALYLGLIAYIAGPLVLVPLVILTAFAVASAFLGSWLNMALKERDKADDNRYNFLIESLKGIHTIKSFSLERPFQRRYERLQYDATISNYGVTEATSNTFNTGNIFSHIMLAAVISAGAWQVLEGHITSGALIATILLSGRVMQPVQRALGLWARYQDYCVARQKVQELFALPLVESRAKTTPEPERKGNIALSHVGFRVSDKDQWMFRDVNLRLKLGESVQISGNYGCGKTTLLKMMAGLYPATEGKIRIDDLNPLDYKPEALMGHIGFMPTQGVIFRGRIRDNLTRFGTIAEEQVRPIAAMLGIEQEVARLPRGFDTWMDGVEQDSVPPGLRQRIAIARVLAARPRILLFDNADRNLDREGYRQIHAMLGRLKEKVAMILVTDDQNLARLADRHMILSDTGLVEVNTKDESQTLFRELRA